MRTFKFNSDNLDEITFEHRNKEYGAYELRKSYDSRLIKSFMSTLALIGVSFGAVVLIQQFFTKEVLLIPPLSHEKIYVEKIFTIEKPEKINSVQQTHKPPKQNAIVNTPFRVLKDSLLTRETKKDTVVRITNESIAVNSKGNDSSNDTSTDHSPLNSVSGNTTTTSIASTQPYNSASVDKLPQFHGGEAALMNFLENNIHFIEPAKRAGVNGRIYASFIINSKGEVEAIKILHGLGYGLDEEVVRVLNSMPRWEPGYFHGTAVSTIMNIPVSFSLIQ